MRSLPALMLAAASAVAFSIATRPNAWGSVAWIGSLLLHEAVRRSDRRRTAMVATALAASGACSVAITAFVPLRPLVSVLALIGLSACFSLVGAVSYRAPAASTRPDTPLGRGAQAITIVGSWCGIEAAWGSAWLAGGYALPILSIGTALADGPLRSIAGTTGTLGLSATLLSVGGLASWLARSDLGFRRLASPCLPSGLRVRRRAAARVGGVVLLLTVAVVASLPRGARDAAPGEALAGEVLAGDVPTDAARPPGRVLRLRLVQHVPTPQSIAAAGFDTDDHRRGYAPLFDALDDAEGRLVVWPEATWPRPIVLDGATAHGEARVDPPSLVLGAVPHDVSLVFGAGTVVATRVRNSVLLASRGRLTRLADKARLVPWTEGSLEAGEPGSVVRWNGVTLAAAVCWDVVFPSVARAAARAGADVLLLLANDAYAGTGPVGALHLRQARLRAVETSLPVVFVQATGPSAVIDRNGRLIAVLAEGARGHLDVDLPLAAAHARTKGGDRPTNDLATTHDASLRP